MIQVPLHRIAHGRAGDKGDISNISVIAYAPELFSVLSQVTAERVAALFGVAASQVKRYELPLLGALNFVIDGALEGGVNRSLRRDAHGKTLAFVLLNLLVEVPAEIL